jgi:nucleoid-associated protein Lsr2
VAQHIQVTLVDDVDGSKAAETVSFSFEGKAYELDLSEKNANKLRKALEPFVAAARRGGGGGRRRQRGSSGTSRGGADRERTAAIRKWAREHGHQVADRGRIPSSVVEAYEKQAG